MSEHAFWIDRAYDRGHADERGGSRYHAYVRGRADAFADAALDDTEDPDYRRAGFAAVAWRVACGPIMAPAYVCRHSRVLGAELTWNYQEGGLAATVVIATGLPTELQRLRDWGGRRWTNAVSSFADLYLPDAGEATGLNDGKAYLATTVRAVFGLDTAALPLPDPDQLEWSATAFVEALVPAMNHVVDPIIGLEGTR